MPEARIISYDSIYYHTAYGETPDFIEGIANNTVLDATYLPALVADGMQFMGWYSTHTFDDGTEVSVGDLVRDHSTNGSLHLYAKWSTITVSSVLTNLADEIRVLSGTTEPLGLTEMATNVNDANDEVADQTDLIAQVASALQGKSVPGGGEDVTAETETYTDLLADLEAAVDALPDAGGGSSGGGAETCTVEIVALAPVSTNQNITYINSDGESVLKKPTNMEWVAGFTLTIRINSPLAFGVAMSSHDTDNIIKMSHFCYYVTGDATLTIEG